MVQAICNEEETAKKFSETLDKATIASAQYAFLTMREKNKGWVNSDKVPFRPVVIGGDDLTMICRADLAIEYTTLFMKKFEELTSIDNKDFKGFVEKAGLEGLSACAGIAVIKSS